jgi:hypothetical protein
LTFSLSLQNLQQTWKEPATGQTVERNIEWGRDEVVRDERKERVRTWDGGLGVDSDCSQRVLFLWHDCPSCTSLFLDGFGAISWVLETTRLQYIICSGWVGETWVTNGGRRPGSCHTMGLAWEAPLSATKQHEVSIHVCLTEETELV